VINNLWLAILHLDFQIAANVHETLRPSNARDCTLGGVFRDRGDESPGSWIPYARRAGSPAPHERTLVPPAPVSLC
jgi:hypothetical protein